jgi:hypothetical protein
MGRFDEIGDFGERKIVKAVSKTIIWFIITLITLQFWPLWFLR